MHTSQLAPAKTITNKIIADTTRQNLTVSNSNYTIIKKTPAPNAQLCNCVLGVV